MPEETTSGGNRLNPFNRRDTHSDQTILLYKITTALSYVIFVITAIYYTFNRPHDGHNQRFNRTIWEQNTNTAFAQNHIVTSVYWIVTLILQGYYLFTFYKPATSAHLAAAANLAPHFIASNLLLFGFINLWVRSHFWLALLLLIINFFNLSFAYFRNSTTPLLIHTSVLSAPLAWAFVSLYWAGARAFVTTEHANNLAARIVGNIFIWGILAYGAFFLVTFKDATIGLALSVLAFSTGAGQFLTKLPIFQLQWIFSFTIGALLFFWSVATATGKDPIDRGIIVSEDRERAPLLADDNV